MKRLVLTHDKFRKDMESREMDTQKEMANVQLSLAELDKKRTTLCLALRLLTRMA
jgi:hypothetical protein